MNSRKKANQAAKTTRTGHLLHNALLPFQFSCTLPDSQKADYCYCLQLFSYVFPSRPESGGDNIPIPLVIVPDEWEATFDSCKDMQCPITSGLMVYPVVCHGRVCPRPVCIFSV